MTEFPFAPRSGGAPANNEAAPQARGLRLFWGCLALGLVALILLVWLFGLTWWVILIAALVIACPAIMAWMLLGGLDASDESQRIDR